MSYVRISISVSALRRFIVDYKPTDNERPMAIHRRYGDVTAHWVQYDTDEITLNEQLNDLHIEDTVTGKSILWDRLKERTAVLLEAIRAGSDVRTTLTFRNTVGLVQVSRVTEPYFHAELTRLKESANGCA